MKVHLLPAVASAFALVALASAPVASADPDQNFLATLEQGGFTWPDDAAAQALVDLGRGVCQELATGARVGDMIAQGAAETGWSQTQVGFFIGAATNQFCPEQAGRVMEDTEGLGG